MNRAASHARGHSLSTHYMALTPARYHARRLATASDCAATVLTRGVQRPTFGSARGLSQGINHQAAPTSDDATYRTRRTVMLRSVWYVRATYIPPYVPPETATVRWSVRKPPAVGCRGRGRAPDISRGVVFPFVDRSL